MAVTEPQVMALVNTHKQRDQIAMQISQLQKTDAIHATAQKVAEAAYATAAGSGDSEVYCNGYKVIRKAGVTTVTKVSPNEVIVISPASK